jgi:hypothetical protein
LRSFIIAAVVAAAFASGANAAAVDYFNKNTNPLAANTRMGGGGGTGKSYQGGGSGAGKVTAHCAPGAHGKACHKS